MNGLSWEAWGGHIMEWGGLIMELAPVERSEDGSRFNLGDHTVF